MMEINNLKITKKINDRVLVDNLNLVVHKNDKIAIIGEEGNGKSTLLKCFYNVNLINDYCNISGTIKCNEKLGYLEQTLDERWNNEEVINYFLKDSVESEIDYSKYNEIDNIYSLFSELNISREIIDSNRLFSTLSGGEKVKIQLIKLLLNKVDILLLDEPSNDLDLETLQWLETFISNYNKAIIFISHDETLLENTCNTVIHLEQIMKKTEARITIKRLDYNSYINERFNLIERQNNIANKEKEQFNEKMDKWRQIYQRVDHEQATISRQDPHGGQLLKKKMHSVKAMEKKLVKEKESLTKTVDTEDCINISFNYNVLLPKSKVIYNETMNKLMVSNKLLSQNIKLTIKAQDHIVIVGKNGVGKTTYLKHIYNNLKNSNLKIGYMPQNYDERLEGNKNVLDYICNSKDKDNITLAMTFLGSLKFSEEEMYGKISELSGGQKAKLLLIKLILDKCEVLVLDEPTRNLSPLSNPVIRKILSNYKGCIISISHDRKYIKEVSTNIYELSKDGLKEIFL